MSGTPDFQPTDTARAQVFAIIASIVLLVSILELIRRGKLREEYSFIWLGSAIVFLFFSIWRGAFEALGEFFGIAYRPALLILVILFAGFLILVRFSVVISTLTAENKRLAQEMALLHRDARGRGESDSGDSTGTGSGPGG
jgi:hypothetical protein